MKTKKAVILLSGGIDSTTTLYYAKSKGFKCYALIFDYGQRHVREIRSAVRIAKAAKIPYQIIKIKLPWKGSSLLDKDIRIPGNRDIRRIGKGGKFGQEETGRIGVAHSARQPHLRVSSPMAVGVPA